MYTLRYPGSICPYVTPLRYPGGYPRGLYTSQVSGWVSPCERGGTYSRVYLPGYGRHIYSRVYLPGYGRVYQAIYHPGMGEGTRLYTTRVYGEVYIPGYTPTYTPWVYHTSPMPAVAVARSSVCVIVAVRGPWAQKGNIPWVGGSREG